MGANANRYCIKLIIDGLTLALTPIVEKIDAGNGSGVVHYRLIKDQKVNGICWLVDSIN